MSIKEVYREPLAEGYLIQLNTIEVEPNDPKYEKNMGTYKAQTGNLEIEIPVETHIVRDDAEVTKE